MVRGIVMVMVTVIVRVMVKSSVMVRVMVMGSHAHI